MSCLHTAVLSSIFATICLGMFVRHAWLAVSSSHAVRQRARDTGMVALPTIIVFGTAALCGGIIGISIAVIRQQQPATLAYRHGGFGPSQFYYLLLDSWWSLGRRISIPP